MYQKLQQMTLLLVQLAAMVTDFSGRPDLLAAVQGLTGDMPGMTDIQVEPSRNVRTNSLGEATGLDTSTAGKARDRAASATEVG